MSVSAKIWCWRRAALSTAIALTACFGVAVSGASAAQWLPLADYVRGRIIVPKQACGLAWYVYPGDNRRYTLGDPDDVNEIIRTFGLGVRHQVIAGTASKPASLAGQILLDVDDHGKAYYVSPADSRAHYLGNGTQALGVLRSLSVSVTDADRLLIPLGDPTLANGCAYHRPDCPADYACVQNSCVLPAGCAYHNPNCGKNEACVNNRCVEKKPVAAGTTAIGATPPVPTSQTNGGSTVRPTGCAYGTVTCLSTQECVNNVCRPKPGEECAHPEHSVCIPPGSRVNPWQCLDGYFEFNGQCYQKTTDRPPRSLSWGTNDWVNGACLQNHGAGAAWDVSENRCVCRDGFSVASNGYNCESADLWCARRIGSNSYYNFILSSCVCKAGHAFVGGTCQ